MDAPPPIDIAFTVRAGKDLQNIRKYLTSKASASVARKVLLRLFDAIETLRAQPERYPPEPLLKEHGNYRVIRKASYKIFYEYTGQEIIILRVIHTRRDLTKIFTNFKP